MTIWHRQLGKTIKTLREANNMRQADLAEKSGVERSQIANLEAGRGNMTLNRVEAIALALGIGAGDLLLLAGYTQGDAARERAAGMVRLATIGESKEGDE